MMLVASSPRRLDPSDFSSDQLQDWIGQSGEGASGQDEPPSGKVEWVLAYTDPQREQAVAKTARQRSFVTYVPAMTVTNRKREDVARPLFPRYVFIGHRGQGFFELRETPGLERIVRDADGRIAPISPETVGALQAQEAAGDFDFTATRTAEAAARAEAKAALAKRAWAMALQPGVLIRMVRGPWRGYPAKVQRLAPPDRIIVLMTFLKREWPIPVPLVDIEALC